MGRSFSDYLSRFLKQKRNDTHIHDAVFIGPRLRVSVKNDNLAEEIDIIVANLQQYSAAIKSNDAQALEALLREGRMIKEAVDSNEND